MKRIYYASGSVVTSDRTADAVVAYAQALAARESSDTIDIPIFAAGAHAGRAQLVVGPASQLMVVTEDPWHEAFEDEGTLDLLARRTEGLLRPKGRPVDQIDLADGTDLST